MKSINVKFIPQSEQRYQTVGDYWETEESYEVRITDFPNNPTYSQAILQHELWELHRITEHGVTIAEIDKFDMNYDYKNGKYKDDVGLDPECPCHEEHMESDVIERICIVMGGEDWIEYEAAIEALFPEE